ncbi:MAG: cytochrome C [Planctomycetes bacterium]|nr:cytochrome C [Planctomycetota bacterium]
MCLPFAAVLAADLSPIEQLGKQIFFDKNLSSPPGQACASCHAPEVGFTGPDSAINQQTGVYPGAAPGRFGNRKPPSAAYVAFSPKREYNAKDETWVGGQFWDGRSDDLVAQAKGPFLNPLEMNNASSQEVVDKVRQSKYRHLFDKVFGPRTLDDSGAEEVFDLIAKAITAYESSREVNAFSSKYDYYLAGQARLTPQEERGLKLFGGKAGCSSCHPHTPEPDGSAPLFTDYSYDNVGTPRNPRNPFYRADGSVNPDGTRYRDLGLGAVLKDQTQFGKVKVPTLRNVAKKPHPQFVKSYLHNGVFKSLKDVVSFYNLRDKTPEEFGEPDVIENVNHEELGKLGLTDIEEDDVVAFLETLSDGYVPTQSGGAQPPERLPSDPQPAETQPTAQNQFPATAPSIPSRNHFRPGRDILRVQRFRIGGLEDAARESQTRRR